MSKNAAIRTLNELIQTSENGEKGFQEAAALTTDPKLRLLFEQCAQECQVAAAQLRDQVLALGGKADDHGSVAGAAHRGWLKLKAAVADGHINAAVLEEVERGEDHARDVYGRALQSGLPPRAKTVVEKQNDSMVRHHELMRRLREQYRGGVNA